MDWERELEEKGADGQELPGSYLRVLRVALDLKQEDVARELGVATSTVSAWEKKERLRREDAERAVLAMGVQPGEALAQTIAYVEAMRGVARPLVPAGAPDANQRQERRQIAAGAGRWLEEKVLELLDRVEGDLEDYTERRRGTFLLSRLRWLAHAERRAKVKESAEYHTWGLALRLCEASLAAAPNDGKEAVEWADLAVLVARLAPGAEAWKARVERYAWAHLGNARKVRNDLRGADQAFDKVHELWRKAEAAAPGPLNEARVLGFEASLRAGERQFDKALALLDTAIVLDRWEEAPYLLTSKAKLLGDQGELEAALAVLERAEPLLESVRDPRLALVARYNAAYFLSLLGHYEKAACHLPAIWRLADSAGELDRIRLVWVQGRIAAGTGQPEEGVAALEQVRREFAGLGMRYDWAMVTLELAVLYLESHQTLRVRELAEEMTPAFKAEGLHREALAALALFWRGVDQAPLSADLGRQVLLYLHKARHNPQARSSVIA